MCRHHQTASPLAAWTDGSSHRFGGLQSGSAGRIGIAELGIEIEWSGIDRCRFHSIGQCDSETTLVQRGSDVKRQR